MARMLNSSCSQIYAPQICPRLGEALMVCSEANTDLENAFAARVFEPGKMYDIWLEVVPSLRLKLVRIPIHPVEIKILATGSLIPEIVYFAFSVH
jgi:hypothetical protein